MRRLAAAPAVLLLLLGGCSGHTTGSRQPGKHGTVAVDTPALRKLKAEAGIATCRPGTATTDLPKVTLPCLGGGPSIDLSAIKGPAVVNLWAQWCGPCRQELPFYQALHRKAKGVAVLGVDYLDPQPDAALELARQSGVTYPLVADPDGTLRAPLRVRGLPGIVLVDAAGKVAAVQYRSVRSYAELRTIVQDGLHVKLPS